MDQIRRIMRPTDVPDTGLLCDLLWSDPDKDIVGWGENGALKAAPCAASQPCPLRFFLPLSLSLSLCITPPLHPLRNPDRGVSFTFGPDVVAAFLKRHDLDLICRAHQVVEDGYEFFAKRQLVTLFSAPNCASQVRCLAPARPPLPLFSLFRFRCPPPHPPVPRLQTAGSLTMLAP